MNVTTGLDINGVLDGGPRKHDGFHLPDTRKIRNSIRFGDHDFDFEQKFLMILPVKDTCRTGTLLSRPGTDAVKSSSRGLSSADSSKMISDRECLHRMFNGMRDILMCCKARATAFFL